MRINTGGIRKLCLLGFCVLVSGGVFAESVQESNLGKHKWTEFGIGLDGGFAAVKYSDGTKGWAGAIASYNEDNFPQSTVSLGGEPHEKLELNTIGLSRFWHQPFGRGYFDYGLGLVAAKGDIVGRCEMQDGGFWTREVCEVENYASFGIPLEMTIGFGQSIGIAANFKLLILEGKVINMAVLTIPIGNFHW